MSQNVIFLGTITVTESCPVTTIECINGKWVSKTYSNIYRMPGDMRRNYQNQSIMHYSAHNR